MKTLWIASVVVVSSWVSVAAAGPKLVNAKRVFPKGEVRWLRARYRSMWAMRLSPDGKSILFARPVVQGLGTTRAARARAKYELVLRDLTTGKDTVPINPNGRGWRTGSTRFNPFDPTGKRLALVPIERPGAAIAEMNPILKVMLFDVASGKLSKIQVKGIPSWPRFNRSGTGLLVGAAWLRGRTLYTAALATDKLKPLGTEGLLSSVCPGADVVCLWAPPKRIGLAAPRRGPKRLVLYDLKTAKQIADLPARPGSARYRDCETQWTTDGRYLYYYDTVADPNGPMKFKTVTRIWDRIANKPAGVVGNAIPVGPGPTPTSMVLAEWPFPRTGGIILHDAKTKREWPVPGAGMHLIHGWGKRIAYYIIRADKKRVAYVAEIVLEPGDIAPAAKTRPVTTDRGLASLFAANVVAKKGPASAAARGPVGDPLSAYARLTKGTTRARFVMTRPGRTFAEKRWQEESGSITVWFDTKLGYYRWKGVQLLEEKGQQVKFEWHLLFTPQGTIHWEAAYGGTGDQGIGDDWSQDKRNKTVPGKCKLLPLMLPMVALVDAAFGYETLKTRAVLVRTPCPLKDKDDLTWYRVTAKGGGKGTGIVQMISQTDGQLWLGFSPKTGWPVKQAVKSKDQEYVLTVVKFDLKGDLKGVFDVPDKVAIRLGDKVLPSKPLDKKQMPPAKGDATTQRADKAATTADPPKMGGHTFSSNLRLQVLIIRETGGRPEWIGETPSVRPLDIPRCASWGVWSVGPVDIEALAREIAAKKIPYLQTDDRVVDGDLAHLKGLTGLRELDLGRGVKIRDAGLAHLKGLVGLRMLRVPSTRITDAGLSHLNGLKGLRVLVLRGAKITDMGLAQVKGLTALRTLNLFNTKITDAGLAHLKGMTELRELDLGYTQITDAGLTRLNALTRLRQLTFNRTKITNAGLAHLKGLKGLRSLHLGQTQITDTGLSHLNGLKGLQELDLTATQITDAGLAQLKGLTRLRELNLGSTKITDAGLAGLKGLTGLRELDLRHTKITDEGLAHLKGLAGLQELVLLSTQITDVGLEHLKGLAGLRGLYLWRTKITDAGLEHIKGLTGLRQLYLGNTKITDTGLAHLKGLTRLRKLSLNRTQITDAGLEHLKGLAGLQGLYLTATKITDAGLADLKKALPKTHIQRMSLNR